MYFNDLFNNFFPYRNSYSFKPQTANQTPYQEDSRNPNIIRQKILSEKSNYFCFDCGQQTNELNYFDLKNGIFLCYNCALKHQKYSKDISEVVTGNIRILEQKYLLPLYYGGNKTLIEFIRNNYPLLERKGRFFIYTTRAIDYYRKLINSKINNEREPCKPSILDGYNSIYSQKPVNNRKTNDENSDDKMDIEPADLNNKEKYNEKEDNVKMEEETRSCHNESDVNTSQDSGSEETNKRQELKNNEIKKKKLNLNLNKENKPKADLKEKNGINERCLTVNQIGNINMYPDAKIIDDME